MKTFAESSSVPDNVQEKIAAVCRGKNQQLAAHIYAYLAQHNPDSVRDVMYEMLNGPLLDIDYGIDDPEDIGNKRNRRVQGLLFSLRRKGVIPWDWVRDGVRESERPSHWRDLGDFIGTVREAYRRDHWQVQDVLPHIVV